MPWTQPSGLDVEGRPFGGHAVVEGDAVGAGAPWRPGSAVPAPRGKAITGMARVALLERGGDAGGGGQGIGGEVGPWRSRPRSRRA
jgi:hypothetical protein